MTLKFLDDYLNDKMEENEGKVVIKFFDLRVKFNLSVEDANFALFLANQKLTNNGYKIYFTGETYVYGGETHIVESNEMLVAIKQYQL